MSRTKFCANLRELFHPRVFGFTIALSFALALFSTLPVAAEGGVLIPREVYVGDTAEFSFKTTAFASAVKDGSAFVLPEEEFPVTPDLTIESVVIAKASGETNVTVRFVPWTAGIIKIPSIVIGKETAVPPPMRISSIIEKTGHKTLEPSRSPLLVPGTTFIVYAIIAIAIVAVAIIAFAGVRLKRALSGFALGRASARRVKALNRELSALSRSARKKGLVPWYADFSRVLRRYLGEFAEGNPQALFPATTREALSRALDGTGVAPFCAEGLRAGLEGLLSRVDEIRFSGARFDDARAADIEAARGISSGLEASLSRLEADAREKDAASESADARGRPNA
ncbi:MAG TPA: hypothetical protein PKO22_03150 [Treponemataceae bacterium]|nr:hypothetical protein [Treponemataceae bacterium]